MKEFMTRRDFLRTTSAAAAISALPSFGAGALPQRRFSFILLGDK